MNTGAISMTTHSDTEKMLTEGRVTGMQLGLGRLSDKHLWQIFTAMDAVRTPPHPTEVGEAVGEAGSMPGTAGFTIACFKASDVPIGTKLYSAQGLHVYTPPASVDGKTQEYTLRAMAMNYSGGHSWDHLDSDACRNGADEIASLRALLAAANSAEGKVVPDGYVLVPVEPTEAMLEAGQNAHYEAEEMCRVEIAEADVIVRQALDKTSMRFRKNRAAHSYKAMLNATASTSRGS